MQKRKEKREEAGAAEGVVRTDIDALALDSEEAIPHAILAQHKRRREQKLAAVLELKTNTEAIHASLRSQNAQTAFQNDALAKAQADEFDELRQQGKNPYEVYRRRKMEQQRHASTLAQTRRIHAKEGLIAERMLAENNVYKREAAVQAAHEEYVRRATESQSNRVKEERTRQYMIEKTTDGTELIDPSGRTFRIQPSQVTNIKDHSFGQGKSHNKTRSQRDQMIDAIARKPEHRNVSLMQRFLPKKAAQQQQPSQGRNATNRARDDNEMMFQPPSRPAASALLPAMAMGANKTGFLSSTKSSMQELEESMQREPNEASLVTQNVIDDGLSPPLSSSSSSLDGTKEARRGMFEKPKLSVLEQRMMQQALTRQRAFLTQKQIVCGKEFQGQPFLSTPATIHFKDFVVHEPMSMTFELTNVSNTFNHFKLEELSEGIRDFFVISYSKPGRISAGMSCKLTIHFTPKINQDIESEIPFLAQSGPFAIALLCTTQKALPVLSSQRLVYQDVLVGETSKQVITLTNEGALSTDFTIEEYSFPSRSQALVHERSQVSMKDSTLSRQLKSNEDDESLADEELVDHPDDDKDTRRELKIHTKGTINDEGAKSEAGGDASSKIENENIDVANVDQEREKQGTESDQHLAHATSSTRTNPIFQTEQDLLDKVNAFKRRQMKPSLPVLQHTTKGRLDSYGSTNIHFLFSPHDAITIHRYFVITFTRFSFPSSPLDMINEEMEHENQYANQSESESESKSKSGGQSADADQKDAAKQTTLVKRSTPNSFSTVSKPNSLFIECIASGCQVPIFVTKECLDFKCCVYDKLYRTKVVLRNRGKIACKTQVKVPKELRDCIEFLPSMCMVQGAMNAHHDENKMNKHEDENMIMNMNKHEDENMKKEEEEDDPSREECFRKFDDDAEEENAEDAKTAGRFEVQIKFKPTRDMLQHCQEYAYYPRKSSTNTNTWLAKNEDEARYEASKNSLNEASFSKDDREAENEINHVVIAIPICIVVSDQTLPVYFTLKAQLTSGDLVFHPSTLDFGECVRSQSKKQRLTLRNPSELPQKFGFLHLPTSLSVQPNDGFGILLPREETFLDITFSPSTSASSLSFQASIVCQTSMNKKYHLPVVASLRQSSNVQLSATLFLFPAMSFHEKRQQKLIIANTSSTMPQTFEFSIPPALQQQLEMSPCVATLLPKESKCVEISFQPTPFWFEKAFPRSNVVTKSNPGEEEESSLNPCDDETSSDVDMENNDDNDKEGDEDAFMGSDSEKGAVQGAMKRELLPRSNHGLGNSPLHDLEDAWETFLYTNVPREDGCITRSNGCLIHQPSRALDQQEKAFLSNVPSLANWENAWHALAHKEQKSIHSTWWIPCFVQGEENNKSVQCIEIHTTLIKEDIVVSSRKIDFGPLACGNVEIAKLQIRNQSLTETFLNMEALNAVGPFQVVNALRSVPGHGGWHNILIEFRPTYQQNFQETLTLLTRQGHISVLLRGEGVSPTLRIEPEDGILDFGHVLATESSNRTFMLCNTSEFPLTYQIIDEGDMPTTFNHESTFACVPREGSILAGKKQIVTVTFSPDHEVPAPLKHTFQIHLPNQSKVSTPRRIHVKGCSWERQLYLWVKEDENREKEDERGEEQNAMTKQSMESVDVEDHFALPQFFSFTDLQANLSEVEIQFLPRPPMKRVYLEFPRRLHMSKEMPPKYIVLGSIALVEEKKGSTGSFSVAMKKTNETNNFFTIEPMKGSLTQGQQQLLTIRFNPPQDSTFHQFGLDVGQWIEQEVDIQLDGGYRSKSQGNSQICQVILKGFVQL